uniref:Uncharacterized protein n=1 Tax=Moniliophthora roreri TaxID=221103 RepID=A0A0W0FI28_MONRR
MTKVAQDEPIVVQRFQGPPELRENQRKDDSEEDKIVICFKTTVLRFSKISSWSLENENGCLSVSKNDESQEDSEPPDRGMLAPEEAMLNGIQAFKKADGVLEQD